MSPRQELKKMLKEFDRVSLEFPKLIYYAGQEAFIGVLERDSDSLDLSTHLHVLVHPEIPEELDVVSALKGQILINHTVSINYSSIYSDTELEINPNEWHTLPGRFKEESNLIEQLDDYLPKDRESKILRDTIDLDYTWQGFYSELIRQGKLRWADILGEQFPYVVTDSSVLGNVGRSVGGLYFVSVDIAKEPWQEQIVAFHERFHLNGKHEDAVRKERELVSHLGKYKEYQRWRKGIDNAAKKGRYLA